jgi:hypothetical protein
MSTTLAVIPLLGLPLYQVRQLIKDLTFRNAHERARCELDLLERRTQITGTRGPAAD